MKSSLTKLPVPGGGRGLRQMVLFPPDGGAVLLLSTGRAMGLKVAASGETVPKVIKFFMSIEDCNAIRTHELKKRHLIIIQFHKV